MPGSPRAARENLQLDGCADCRLEHTARVALPQRISSLVWAKLGVKSEFPTTIDGSHESEPLGIERDVHPRRGVRDELADIRAAHIERVHARAHKIPDHPGLADIAEAQAFADEAPGPIRTEEIAAPHAAALPVSDSLDLTTDGLSCLLEIEQSPAILHRNARQFLGVAAQDRLDKLLRNPVRQLRRIPGTAQADYPCLGIAR